MQFEIYGSEKDILYHISIGIVAFDAMAMSSISRSANVPSPAVSLTACNFRIAINANYLTHHNLFIVKRENSEYF